MIENLANRWREAVWESDMPSLRKLAALCYADHTSTGADVWVATARATARTGMSRSTWYQETRALVSSGWLLTLTRGHSGRSGGRTATYRLCVPLEHCTNESASRTHSQNESGSRTNESGSRTNESARAHPSPTPSPTSTPPSPLAPDDHRRVKLRSALRAEGIEDDEDIERVVQISQEDPETKTSGVGRLLDAPLHRDQCVALFRGEVRQARQRLLDAEPRCETCGKPFSVCELANRNYAREDRCHRLLDRTAAGESGTR